MSKLDTLRKELNELDKATNIIYDILDNLNYDDDSFSLDFLDEIHNCLYKRLQIEEEKLIKENK